MPEHSHLTISLRLQTGSNSHKSAVDQLKLIVYWHKLIVQKQKMAVHSYKTIVDSSKTVVDHRKSISDGQNVRSHICRNNADTSKNTADDRMRKGKHIFRNFIYLVFKCKEDDRREISGLRTIMIYQ